jgi:hypothetical protein
LARIFSAVKASQISHDVSVDETNPVVEMQVSSLFRHSFELQDSEVTAVTVFSAIKTVPFVL